jgi:flagella basal body P-ring formation protein FlgA
MIFFITTLLISLSNSDIEKQIRDNLNCPDCEIKILSIHIPLGMRLDSFDSVEIVPKDSKVFGRRVFTAYFKKEGKNFIGTVFAFIDKKVKIVRAKRRLERGETLKPDEFETQDIFSTLAPQDFISPDDIENANLILKVPMGKGEILRRTHIQEDFAIRKGDKVKLVLNSSSIYIEFPGLALSNAKEGERVKVRNLSSNKIIYGEAKSGKVVEIK